MTKILCDKCNKEIKYKEDLVVTTYIIPFILRKYHNACYAQREKTAGGFIFLGPKPVNTNVFTAMGIFFSIFFFLIFAIALLNIPGSASLSLLIFLIIAIVVFAIFFYPRVASYYKYEKALPHKK